MYQIKITDQHCFGFFDDADDFYLDNDFESVDKQNIELIKSIGKRMREARELCNLKGIQAAKLLDVDSTFLRNLEDGIDTSVVPLNLIHRASERYDVSMDFLFGSTDDWERSEDARFERETNFWFQDAQLAVFSELATEQLRQQNKRDVLAKTIVALLQSVAEIEAALHRFVELNPEFYEMMGGNTINVRVKAASEIAEQAERNLTRCRVLPVNEEALENG